MDHDLIEFRLVDPAAPVALEALGAYFAELDERFVGGFDPGDTLVADARGMRPPGGAFVVAVEHDVVIGCGAVVHHAPDAGEIKRMWIAPSARGRGVGRRLLDELERHVARLGYGHIVLDTNEVLDEAIAMYTSAGYTEIDRYNDNPYAMHWFEKCLVDAPGGA